MTEQSRCKSICLVAALGMAVGMVMSWRLWVAPVRDFSPVPLKPWMDLPPAIAAGVLPVLLMGMVMGWRASWGLLGVAAWGVLVAGDAMRLQPWVYQYVLIACIAGGRPRATRLVMAGVFLWAGISKFNPGFSGVGGVGPWLTSNLPPMFKGIYRILPETEIAAGLALLGWGRISNWLSRILVAGISIGAIVCLVSQHWNTVVWPWQGVNLVLVWLATSKASISQTEQGQTERSRLVILEHVRNILAATLSLALPAFCFIGFWPAYCSWRLYDGRPGPRWELQERALAELNVPIPPDAWLLKRLDSAHRAGVDQTILDGEE